MRLVLCRRLDHSYTVPARFCCHYLQPMKLDLCFDGKFNLFWLTFYFNGDWFINEFRFVLSNTQIYRDTQTSPQKGRTKHLNDKCTNESLHLMYSPFLSNPSSFWVSFCCIPSHQEAKGLVFFFKSVCSCIIWKACHNIQRVNGR